MGSSSEQIQTLIRGDTRRGGSSTTWFGMTGDVPETRMEKVSLTLRLHSNKQEVSLPVTPTHASRMASNKLFASVTSRVPVSTHVMAGAGRRLVDQCRANPCYWMRPRSTLAKCIPRGRHMRNILDAGFDRPLHPVSAVTSRCGRDHANDIQWRDQMERRHYETVSWSGRILSPASAGPMSTDPLSEAVRSAADGEKQRLWMYGSPYLKSRLFYSPVSYIQPHRNLQTSCVNLREPSSKVEQTVNALKEEQKQTENDLKAQKQTGIGSKDEVKQTGTLVAKRPLSKRVWDEVLHYYHGFRLLFIDIKIASRLVYDVLNGHELSRREYRQLSRTTADIFRLVPFSIFVIVPFMEFLLPVFLKFFPGMLPSTFMSTKDKESKVKQQLKVKLDMTKFLQTTLDEMALTSKGGEHHSESAKEFADFFNQIRKSGEIVSNESILKFSKLFEDEITLDSLSRPQLIALCRLLELKPIGPNYVLRFQLRMQLRSLKSDDLMIQKEGVNSLTVPELQQACRSRGMRALGVAEDRLRTQLAQWLELSLNERIPPSLLLLSRILYLPEDIPAADQLKATIQALPSEVGTEAKYKIGETEGKIDNKTRLELIRQEEAAIRLEKEEAAMEAKAKAEAAVHAVTPDREMLTDSALPLVDHAAHLEPATQASEQAKEGELSPEDLDKLEQALDQITKDTKSMAVEKEELEDIKEEMADYKEDIEQFQEIAKLTGKKQLVESSAARSLRKRVDKMISKMDTVMEELESKKEKIQEKLQVLPTDQEAAVQSEKENLVTINEILSGIRKIQAVEDDAKLKTIIDVLDSMDVDHDGKVDVEHVVNVIELLGRENVNVSPDQMKDIIKLLIREDLEKEKEKSEKINEASTNNGKASATSASSEATKSAN